MKTIKNLTIKTTFTVGLGDLKVPNAVYNGLCKIEADYHGEMSDNIGRNCHDKDISAAFEWLSDNIEMGDACDWEFEIYDFAE